MKQITARHLRTSAVALAATCALAFGLGSTSAVAAFVDNDHSAASVKASDNGTTKPYYRVPKPGIFIDHEHSSEGARSGAPASSSKGSSVMGGVFIDWDHRPSSVGS